MSTKFTNEHDVYTYDHNLYILEVSGVDTHLDVLCFHGEEQLSQPFTYCIEFTASDLDLAAETILNRIASFSLYPSGKPKIPRGFIVPDFNPLRTVHGVITAFKRLSASIDEARYEVTLQPRLALLGRGQQFRIYQNQSVDQIVKNILRDRHSFENNEFRFELTREYPRREQVMQYAESDLTFLNRLLADVGIWYRFDSEEKYNVGVVYFHDDYGHYKQPRIELPTYTPSGLNSDGQDAVWDLQTSHQVVEKHVNIRSYNPQDIHAYLDGEIDQTRGVRTTYGEAYHYAEPYTELSNRYDFYEKLPTESGYFYARLRHERYLNNQARLSGVSSSAMLTPGQILDIQGDPLQSFKLGSVLTHLSTRGARDRTFTVNFKSIPWSPDVCFRPPVPPKPKMAGTIPARLTSPTVNYPYSEIDLKGRYRVSFMFDRDTWEKGGESMWLRLARPYAGDTYGLHFPLIPGTEVAVAFEQGDPDRPYIAHALHDNEHPDHVTLAKSNYRRNVLRTPANNKLRMEDDRGVEHIKLSTEHSGKSQLNLGHLVNAGKQKRGEGFELRTDGKGAIRAGKGLFISADEQTKAEGGQLDMEAAISQLEDALSLARSLAQAARSAASTAGDTDSQQRLAQALMGLAQPGVLVHAPAGIGIVSPKAVCLSSGAESVVIVAAQNTDISAGKHITAVAEEGVSVFATSADLKLKAGKGKVDLHALGGSLHALAKTDVKIESVAGRVEITAPQELVLNCGGAYIRLKGGEIELGAPGNIYLKAAHVQQTGAASLTTVASPLPGGYSAGYDLKDEAQMPQPFTRYRITTQQGEVFSGVTDKNGQTMSVHTLVPGNLTIAAPDDLSKSGPGCWVTIDHNYHGLKNTASMLLNRLMSMGDEGRLFGSDGKDYANTRRDKVQEWQRFLEDADEPIVAQSAHHLYGSRRYIAQTFLEGDDAWVKGGKSWYWQPAIADTVNELKGIS
ncbi:type VI secretion system Vgr family protein [Pseudomonas sp. LB3P31]